MKYNHAHFPKGTYANVICATVAGEFEVSYMLYQGVCNVAQIYLNPRADTDEQIYTSIDGALVDIHKIVGLMRDFQYRMIAEGRWYTEQVEKVLKEQGYYEKDD